MRSTASAWRQSHRLNSPPMSRHEILEKVSDDAIRLPAVSCDHTACENARPGIPFDVDGAVPGGLGTPELHPSGRPARLQFFDDEKKVLVEGCIAGNSLAQAAPTRAIDLNHRLHRPTLCFCERVSKREAQRPEPQATVYSACGSCQRTKRADGLKDDEFTTMSGCNQVRLDLQGDV